MNFAENILFAQKKGTKGGLSTAGKEDQKVAITEVREGVTEIRHVTWRELRRGVGKLAQAMKTAGVKRGDRIAGTWSMRIAQLQPPIPYVFGNCTEPLLGRWLAHLLHMLSRHCLYLV